MTYRQVLKKLLISGSLFGVILGAWSLVATRFLVTATVLVILGRGLWLYRIWRRPGPRPRADIAVEALQLALVPASLLLIVLMLTTDLMIVSAINYSAAVAAGTLAGLLQLLPNVIPIPEQLLRRGCRIAIIVPAVALALFLASTRHPYALAVGAKHRHLLAAKVWSLEAAPSVFGHGDKLFAYARDLEAAGRPDDALVAYERGLVLTPLDFDAHTRAAALSSQLGFPDAATRHHQLAVTLDPAVAPLRVPADRVRKIPSLPETPPTRLLLCLVPFGDVPDTLIDWLGNELEARSGVPVCRFGKTFPLPAPDRSHGTFAKPQWQAESLLKFFLQNNGPLAPGPYQYLLICSGDLYTDDRDFVWSYSANLHASFSFARLADGKDPVDSLLVDRLAKIAFACSIKSFGVPPFPTPDCVTLHVETLEELDRKAQVPSPATDQAYRTAIAVFEHRNPLVGY